MKRVSINSLWRDYAEKILPAGAPRVQMQESKRTFYAGAASMYDAIKTGLDTGDDVTDDDMAHMKRLHEELMTFAGDVKAGRA